MVVMKNEVRKQVQIQCKTIYIYFAVMLAEKHESTLPCVDLPLSDIYTKCFS